MALTALRGLCGTVFDEFGYSRERKIEHRLIGEYRNAAESLLAEIDERNHDLSVEFAELPQQMRGFGPVKLANIERVKAEETRLLERRHARG